MNNLQANLVHDLSIKYVFENFDFKNNSPEELLQFYQETSTKITNVIEEQESKIAEEELKSFLQTARI